MSGFIDIIWLIGVGMVLAVTLPIWFVPYTVYKGWKYYQAKLKEKNFD